MAGCYRDKIVVLGHLSSKRWGDSYVSPTLRNSIQGRRAVKGKLFQALVMLIVTTPFGVVYASNNNATFQSVDIQRATLTLADDGMTAILRFSIRNETPDTLTFLGVRSSVFEQSEILVKLEASKTLKLSSLSIASEEMLDLTTNHIFVKLKSMKPLYKMPDEIEMLLLLVDGELPFLAHTKSNYPAAVQRKSE